MSGNNIIKVSRQFILLQTHDIFQEFIKSFMVPSQIG